MEWISRAIATAVGRTEGPVIREDGEIVFVSIDHGIVYSVDDRGVDVLASVGAGVNGATEGHDAKIYVAQNGFKHDRSRRNHQASGGVQVVSRNGAVNWLTMDPIAPADLCFGPDGLLYVTDPTRFREARDDGRLFRCDVVTGEAELLCSVPWFPNGIGFGLDDALYVASTGDGRIIRYSMDSGRLGRAETFIEMDYGLPDGFAFDCEGNLILAALPPRQGESPSQIQVYDSNGKLVERFVSADLSHRYTNVALGSDGLLVITDSGGRRGQVLTIEGWPNQGLTLYPFRESRRIVRS